MTSAVMDTTLLSLNTDPDPILSAKQAAVAGRTDGLARLLELQRT
jgi:hypothetical protein